MTRAIFVLGRGASGQAASQLAQSLGYQVSIADDHAALPPRDIVKPEFAVVSPGLALTHPLVVECRERGIPLKSELQFGCEELKRRGWKLLAVTGSKGKSSVVKLCAEALGGVPCGNYGTPVCEVAYCVRRDSCTNSEPRTASHKPRTSPWAIVEVSSFQLETTELPSDTFEAAAILNLQEDHLDRHGSVEVYHALKRKLLDFAQHAIDCASVSLVDADSRPLKRTDVQGTPVEIIRGSYFDNPILRENGWAAVALLRVAGLDDIVIRRTFLDFQPLPHRFQVVAEIKGVKYIEDSKATSLAALAAGVKMAAAVAQSTVSDLQARVRLIAGGLPKGDDPKMVVPILTTEVKKVYLIGRSAETFSSAWSGVVDCEICGTLERAVLAARREAQSGETVLLSPGCASFDQFKSFGERGDAFAALIKRKKENE